MCVKLDGECKYVVLYPDGAYAGVIDKKTAQTNPGYASNLLGQADLFGQSQLAGDEKNFNTDFEMKLGLSFANKMMGTILRPS